MGVQRNDGRHRELYIYLPLIDMCAPALALRLVVCVVAIFAFATTNDSVLASEAVPPAHWYATPPEVSGVRISPSGNRVLMLRPVDGALQPYVGDLTTGRGDVSLVVPQSAAGRSGKLLLGCEWASNDRFVCSYLRFPGVRSLRGERPPDGYPARGGRVVRLLAADHDGSNVLALVPPPDRGPVFTWEGRTYREPELRALDEGEHRVVSYLPTDPKHILIGVSREHLVSYGVYRLNIHNNELTPVTPYHETIMFWSADGQGRVRVGVGTGDTTAPKSNGHLQRKLVAADGRGRFVEVRDSPLGTSWFPPTVLGYTADSSSAFVQAYDVRRGRSVVWQASATTLEIEKLIAADPQRDLTVDAVQGDECGLVGFADRTVGSFTWLDDDFGRSVTALDRKLPGTVRAVPSLSADCSKIVVLASGGRSTPTYYLHDRDTGETSRLGSRNAALDGRLGDRRRFSYVARDGERIEARVILPAAAGQPLPLVIMPDGGRSGATPDYDPWAEFLASRGYAVAIPAVRGAPGRGDDHQMAGLVTWGAKMQDDMADAVRALAVEGLADPELVCYVGRGHGGYTALVGAFGPESRARCAASFAFDDMRSTLFDFSRARRDWLWRRWLDLPGGKYWEDFWDADLPVVAGITPAADGSTMRSPLLDVRRAEFPLLLGVGRLSSTWEARDGGVRKAMAQAGELALMLPPGSAREAEFLGELETFLNASLGRGN